MTHSEALTWNQMENVCSVKKVISLVSDATECLRKFGKAHERESETEVIISEFVKIQTLFSGNLHRWRDCICHLAVKLYESETLQNEESGKDTYIGWLHTTVNERLRGIPDLKDATRSAALAIMKQHLGDLSAYGELLLEALCGAPSDDEPRQLWLGAKMSLEELDLFQESEGKFACWGTFTSCNAHLTEAAKIPVSALSAGQVRVFFQLTTARRPRRAGCAATAVSDKEWGVLMPRFSVMTMGNVTKEEGRCVIHLADLPLTQSAGLMGIFDSRA
jgi:hypothetical protein